MTDITTTFTIQTVDFQDGPYVAANTGQVVDIPAGDTSTSEIGYPPAPGPTPGTIPMDTWTYLTSDGTNYIVASAADGATAIDATYSADASTLTFTFADTAAYGTIFPSFAAAARFTTGGAPFTLAFTVDLQVPGTRTASLTFAGGVVPSTVNPADHIGGTFPVSDTGAAPLTAVIAHTVTLPSTETKQAYAIADTVGSTADIVFPAAVQMIYGASGVEVKVNGASIYTSSGTTAAAVTGDALPLLTLILSADAGADPFAVVLSDMTWSAP